jgi:hypothetical protein
MVAMSRLASIQNAIRQNIAAQAEFERALRRDPDSSGLALMGSSLQKQYERFRADFEDEAARTGVDVCTYRVFGLGADCYPLMGIATALEYFQRLFTIVYEALRPKRRHQRPAEEETEFALAYTFPGSLGVALTLPRQADLFDSEGYLNAAMNLVFEMARSQTSAEILQHSQRVGISAVRQINRWARIHVEYGLGADIQWKGEKTSRLFVQPPQIANLRNVIMSSAKAEPHEATVRGTLVGADMDRKSFHFKTETRQDIRGHFDDAITTEHRAQLPAPYIARLRIATTVIYATGEEDNDYFLISLEPGEHHGGHLRQDQK